MRQRPHLEAGFPCLCFHCSLVSLQGGNPKAQAGAGRRHEVPLSPYTLKFKGTHQSHCPARRPDSTCQMPGPSVHSSEQTRNQQLSSHTSQVGMSPQRGGDRPGGMWVGSVPGEGKKPPRPQAAQQNPPRHIHRPRASWVPLERGGRATRPQDPFTSMTLGYTHTPSPAPQQSS